ncbi:UNVERIFIED_CONTAM: MoaA/NifB/PqqE/SkfB family radical SAM enzyme [Acetivibrio alkalicellulosi]
MNTIKFSDGYSLKTETHNVEIYDSQYIEVNGKSRLVDSHCSIMIYPSLYCNAKCAFCINHFDENIKSCKEIEDDNLYFLKLREALKLLKHLKPTVHICGGEPTISHRILSIMGIVKEFGLLNRSFPTNGTGLLKRYEGKLLLQHMLENGLTNNINLSRSSHIDKNNQKLMGICFTNKDIETVATFCNVNHMSFRISCVLHKFGIDSLEDLISFHEYYRKLNIKSTIFREMVKVPKVNRKEKFVDIEPIMNQLDSDSRFEKIRTMQGEYYLVNVYRYKESIVKCYREKFKDDRELIRDFVFMPDGEVYIARNNKPNERLLGDINE